MSPRPLERATPAASIGTVAPGAGSAMAVRRSIAIPAIRDRFLGVVVIGLGLKLATERMHG